jgi:sigma-B regulation protein RsbU (phosphoserine phosphatase)
MEIGREIQKGFLPAELPKVDGWEIASYFKAAREVAGDFYDAFYLSSEHKICLVIADVCDKGVGAALFMTLFRSLLRFTIGAAELFGEQSSISRLKHAVTLTNNYIADAHGDTNMFATIFLGLLDPADGTLIYVNAGHEYPLVVNSGGICASLKQSGPAVGVIPDAKFSVEEVQLQHGDLFFAFTDGAPDALNPAGISFGSERLLSLLNNKTSAETLLAYISEQLNDHIGQTEQFDDITLLVAHRLQT